MFLSTVRSFLFVALAHGCLAGPPEISIGLNTASGSSSKLGGLEPRIKWQTAGSLGDADVTGGIDITIKDVDTFKDTVWGKIQKSVKGFGLSAGAKLSTANPDDVDLDFQCDAPSDTKLQVLASTTAGDFSVDKVKAVQAVDTAVGAVVAAPSYDLGSKKGDLSLAFARDDASSIQVDVNTDKDVKVTLSQRLGNNHVVKPSLTNDGQFELDYDAKVAHGTITTTYKPDHHINVNWSDGPWQANFLAPMSGYYGVNNGVKVSVKTKVDIDYGSLL